MADTHRKIVFLDVDGVLNSDRYVAERESPKAGELWTSADLDPVAIQALNAIVAQTGASIVVSSSWRHHHTLDELVAKLRERGFTGDVIDVTPRMFGEPRGTEIRTWLRAQATEPSNFIVLDDEPATGDLDEYWVRTDPSLGLTEVEVERAVLLLTNVAR